MLSIYDLPVLMSAFSFALLIFCLSEASRFKGIQNIERRYCMPVRLVFGVPWINAYNFAAIELIAGVLGYAGVYVLTKSHILGIVGLLSGCLLPLVVFEAIIQKILLDQEASLSLMFGMLKRWAAIHPDLIKCLARVSDEPLTPALKLALKRLLLSVQHGVEIEKAFDDFSLALDMPLFRDFMIHLKFSARNRGDLVKLFDSFERESYRLFMERNKNRLENRKFKMTIFSLNGASIALFLMMVMDQPHVRGFYLESAVGRLITASLAGMILLTTCMTIFSEARGGNPA